MDSLINGIFSISDENTFQSCAMEVYNYQSHHNPVYKKFIEQLNRAKPRNIYEIPFLPISFYKTHEVRCFHNEIDIQFRSSGTGGQRSNHFVESLALYERSFETCYRSQIGNPEDQIIIALLPNYLEQDASSLIYMVDFLIKKSNTDLSGYYLNDYSKIIEVYNQAKINEKKVVIFGVSYALLDLAENKLNLSQAIIIETGGMKGKRKEITKEQLHKKLTSGFNVSFIASEYGMSELLSQCYSDKNGLFTNPPWMKVLIRDTYDPLSYINQGKTGGINIIDLANVYSCSFISTQDLGKSVENKFQLMGRYDNSDIRGCNLLIE